MFKSKTTIAVIGLIAIALFLYFFNIKREEKTLVFIKAFSVVNERAYIYYDEVNWLTGDEAIKAALESGACDEDRVGECLPNDYFIENKDKNIKRVPLQDKAEIIMTTYKTGEPTDVEEPLSFEEFGLIINNKKMVWKDLPYDINLSRNMLGQLMVTKISERYIP